MREKFKSKRTWNAAIKEANRQLVLARRRVEGLEKTVGNWERLRDEGVPWPGSSAMKEKYRIVDTDNFGGDYPDEKFVGEIFENKEDARSEADRLNATLGGDWASRYYKVELSTYKLKPGFEP